MLTLDLTNFKQYKNVQFDFSEHTLIYGSNGSGKTTILEALTLFFSEQHILYGSLIVEVQTPTEVNNLFQHYVSNKNSVHSHQNCLHFSQKKKAFDIKFNFDVKGNRYFVKKTYHPNGTITVSYNFENDLAIHDIIKAFFEYQFIYYKNPYLPSHLSEGEVAAEFLKSSMHELSQQIKQKNLNKVIVAFDGPDNHLHPFALNPILQQLLSLKVISIVTTTQLQTVEFYIRNKGNITLTQRVGESNQPVSKIEQFYLSESSENLSEKIYSSSYCSNLIPPNKLLIVEGKLEKQFFDALLKDQFELSNVEVLSIDGQEMGLTEENLAPFLNVLRGMYQNNPLIYAMFDFDLEGIEYAQQFARILNKDQIYFKNRKSLEYYITLYDETLTELKALFKTQAISPFGIEDYLKNAVKTQRIRKNAKSSKIINELKDSLSLKLSSYHISDEKLETVLSEFCEWLPQQINLEQELYKNEQQRKFSPLFDSKKINENNLKTSDYMSLKKLLSRIFENNLNREVAGLYKCQKSTDQIKQLQKFKEKLNIPDYVMKINRTTIEYLPNYNYLAFNSRSNEGLMSRELSGLLEILNT